MSSPSKPTVRCVLVITHFYPAHGGGIEIVAGQLVRRLLAAQPELRVEWCASNADVSPPHTPGFMPRPMRAWNGIESRTGLPWPVWGIASLGRLWRAVRRADVIHLHDFIYFGNLLAALFCRLQRKPYVVTQHIGVIPFQSRVLRTILKIINVTLGRFVLGGAARVVFISLEVQRYFAAQGVQGELIPNGVDTAIFHPVSEGKRTHLKRELGVEEGKPLAVFVGRFVEKKGVPLLVELARRTPHVQWFFAGHGPLDPDSAGLPNVRVLRGRRGEQIAPLYQCADLFVLPSQGEGFPLVVQEALACGTRVLCEDSLRRSLPAVGVWLETETLNGNNADRWETKVRALLQFVPRSEETQARAQFARDTWSWETAARLYLQLFSSVVESAA